MSDDAARRARPLGPLRDGRRHDAGGRPALVLARAEREVLGIVGESGCGKSVTMLSLLRLLPPTAVVTGTARVSAAATCSPRRPSRSGEIRGREISFVFQEPMTSLNPAFTVGRQIGEVLQRHLDLSRGDARRRAIELLDLVRIPAPERARRRVPAPALGRDAAARDDRDRARVRPEDPDRGRADDRARRDDPGRDPRPDARHPRPPRDGDRPDHAQPRRRRRHRRPRRRHVRRPQGRGGAGARALRAPAAPVHDRAARRDPAPRRRPAAGDPRARAARSRRRCPHCAFAPRCPRADEPLAHRRCRELREVRPAHLVACFHPGSE